MQRRNDDSDDDEGFKVTNSGRMKGRLPTFLPPMAQDTAVVDALYRSHRGAGVPIEELGDDHPATRRRRIIAEVATKEKKKVKKVELPPLPVSLAQRRKNEMRMAERMELRVANSSPALSIARRVQELREARSTATVTRRRLRTKGWSVESVEAAAAETRSKADDGRPICRSCPPTLGLTGDDVAVSPEYAEKPWCDPQFAERAAAIEKQARTAERERMQQEQQQRGMGVKEREALLKAQRAKMRVPLNDATMEEPRHAYHAYRYNAERTS